MVRRKQILELVRRFDRDFEASLAGLNNEDQLLIVHFLKSVFPLFRKKPEGYYEQFYRQYEKEVLEPLRNKAKKLHDLRLTDYLVQDSMKLVDLQHDLAVKDDDQFLSDEEFSGYMEKISGLLNLKYQSLLLAGPLSPSGKKEKATSETLVSDEGQENDHPVQEMGNREELMTIEECAKFLGVSKVTLHSYKRDHGLPYLQVGRTVKFRKSEVMDFMRKLKNPKKRK